MTHQLIVSACRISIAVLKHERFFDRLNTIWRRTFCRGSWKLLTVDYRLGEDRTAVTFSCVGFERGAEPRAFEQYVEIVERRKLAGMQQWFRCTRCAETVASLFWAEGEPGFACRHCLRLTYTSQALHRVPIYDKLLRHLRVLDTCEARLARANTPGAVARIVRRAAQAGACVDAYAVGLAERVPGAIAAVAEWARDDERDGIEPFAPWWHGPTELKQLELFG